MQEEGQTVGFIPTSVCCVHHPWYVNLFGLYLFFVMLLPIGRSVRLAWTLRKRRFAKRQAESPLESSSQLTLEIFSGKVTSFRNLSHLTVLLSALVLSMSLCRAFNDIATQKVAGIGAIAFAVSDALTTFSAGMLISIGLFCIGVFFERLIGHR